VQPPAGATAEAQSPAGVSRPAPRPSPRTIALVVGALVAAVVVLAIAVNRGGTASPGDAGVASGSTDQPDPVREIVARANELVSQGEREVALDLLNRSRKQYPDSAALSYAAGRIYFSKYYWTDGLKSFRDTLRNDPAYRTDPELIKTVLRGFITTPSYNDELASFLRDDIGSAAQPFLEETARDHPNAAIRSRAANELHRYR
jgi:tetratricopeptide (TPR) repeat protein